MNRPLCLEAQNYLLAHLWQLIFSVFAILNIDWVISVLHKIYSEPGGQLQVLPFSLDLIVPIFFFLPQKIRNTRYEPRAVLNSELEAPGTRKFNGTLVKFYLRAPKLEILQLISMPIPSITCLVPLKIHMLKAIAKYAYHNLLWGHNLLCVFCFTAEFLSIQLSQIFKNNPPDKTVSNGQLE